jgi:hypothetical protein
LTAPKVPKSLTEPPTPDSMRREARWCRIAALVFLLASGLATLFELWPPAVLAMALAAVAGAEQAERYGWAKGYEYRDQLNRRDGGQ